MSPVYDLNYVLTMSSFILILNIVFVGFGWLFYRHFSKNPRFLGIQILPDILEAKHKEIFFQKIKDINKKVRYNAVRIAITNMIIFIMFIIYAFVISSLIDENISDGDKFRIFTDLVFLSIKIPAISFFWFGNKVGFSPIPRAWVALFETENIDTSFLKKSNLLFKLFWRERINTDLLFIHARTFIKEYYPDRLHYLFRLSKERDKFIIFLQKDKEQPYTGFSSFSQHVKNRLIQVLLFNELKMLKARPQIRFHPYSIFGTIIFAVGFFSIPYTIVVLMSFVPVLISFIVFFLGAAITAYGDYILVHLNYESLHTILSDYNIEDTDNIWDRIIKLLDKKFPFTQL